jgi:very-short-patch-repair endonuclease
MKKLTLQEFIDKSKTIHGDKYDYSMVNYKDTRSKVSILCALHGEFLIKPNSHLSGKGCRGCGIEESGKIFIHGMDDFVARANIKHGHKYIYSEFKKRGKMRIECPVHGEFTQLAHNHLKGSGCPKCGINNRAERLRKGKSFFITKSIAVHGEKYDYTNVTETVRSDKKVTIICPNHGSFQQRIHDHVDGHGCAKCAYQDRDRMGFSSYLQNHGKNGFEYGSYVSYFELFEVKCIAHNHTFLTTPHDHSQSPSGKCSYCAKISSPQRFILDVLKDEEVIINSRKIISPYEIDIYLPKYKLAIEVNGLYYHIGKPYNYHEIKFQLCAEKGIQLIQFWDSEIRDKKNLIISFIRNKLGKTIEKYHARKCTLKKLSYKEYSEFLETHHLEGGGIKSSERHGLLFEGVLVAVMGFTGSRLDRFCSRGNVVGGFSKLLSSFRKRHVITYSDNRYSSGLVYSQHGFVNTGKSNSRLFVTDKSYVYNRQRFMRKRLLGFPSYSEDKTAEQILNEVGYYYLYSAGTQRWELFSEEKWPLD